MIVLEKTKEVKNRPFYKPEVYTMKVKGTAFKARENGIVKQFGKERWNEFIEKLSIKEPYFKKSIIATDLIPANAFLTFMEELVREFYSNDRKIYWQLGEKGAEWSIKEGPYRTFFANKDIENFAKTKVSSIWSMYFTEGKLTAEYTPEVIDVKITDVNVKHIYFEYLIMGYAQKSFEIVSGNQYEAKCITGIFSSSPVIHYKFIRK